MRNALLAAGLLANGTVLAHPGHGIPGWLHPHAADYALALLGLCAIAAAAYGLKKRLKNDAGN